MVLRFMFLLTRERSVLLNVRVKTFNVYILTSFDDVECANYELVREI